VGILTPVQIEGLRLLLTPFPTEHLEMAKQQYAMLTSGAPPAAR
jgi:hypothetical protein